MRLSSNKKLGDDLDGVLVGANSPILLLRVLKHLKDDLLSLSI